MESTIIQNKNSDNGANAIDKFKLEMTKQLQRQHLNGLSQGSNAIAQVILNKCQEGNRKGQNPALTLAQIQKFCVTALNVKEKEVE